MRKLMPLIVLLAVCQVATAQRSFPPQAPYPPQAPQQVSEIVQEPKKSRIDDDAPLPPLDGETVYQTVIRGCAKQQRAAIIVVNPKRELLRVAFYETDKPYSSCAVDGLPGYPERCVVIFAPNGRDQIVWRATLPLNATSKQVNDAINGSGVSQSATPFESRPGEVQVADADQENVGLAFLDDLEPYKTARNSQVSFRRWSGYIAAFPRFRLKMEWRVPGGMEGVHGWHSQLYRSRGTSARVMLGRHDPRDGDSTITWQREYPDGTVFADVLRSSSGKVFEVRVAEKRDGVWERFVAYKSAEARPHGYTPLNSRQCAACHAKAGLSEYGEAANPGGDTIFSDGFPVLEEERTVQGGYGTRL